MFKLFKDKLKGALSIFSKKVEEEAKVEEREVEEKHQAEEKEKRRKEEEQRHAEQREEAKKHAEEEKHAAERKEEERQREQKERLRTQEEAKRSKEKSIEEHRKAEQKEKEAEERRAEALSEEKHKKAAEKRHVSPDEVIITYFVHGSTKDNEEKHASGQSQIGLSELGRRQSKELRNKLHDDFDVIISSDLKRAIESAKLTWPDKQILTDKRLRECDYGELTCHKEQDLDRYGIKHDLTSTPFPKGESYHDVEERMRLLLNDIFHKYQGKHVAFISHRNPQLAIEVLLLGKTWKQADEEDWRKKEPKAWQPGWEYVLKGEIPKKEEEKRGGFFSKIFRKKEERQEPTEEPKIPEKKQQIEKETKKEDKKEEEPEEKPEKKGFFKKITETFTTIQISDKKFEEIFWELEVVMLENSVAVEVIEKIKEDLRKELTAQKVSRKKVEDIILDTLKHSIKDLFDVPTIDILKEVKKKKPYVIAFIGVNGSGKTTTLAKFAKMLQDNNRTCVIAAADTFRAAAIQQLEEHANNLGIKLIKQDYKSDPAAVAYDAIQHAKAKDIDVVLIDTAGRLHSNDNLMNELKKLIRVNTPDLKIFVGESITGNDCVEQARLFNEAVGIDGIILAKADVDEKGGAAISVSYITKKPIMYLGMGQKYEDLKKFDPEIVLENLGL